MAPDFHNRTYATQASARQDSANLGDLRVVFAPTVTAAEINAVLAELGGERLGEANSVGALTIRLRNITAGPSREQAIAALRARQDVVLAEPIFQK